MFSQLKRIVEKNDTKWGRRFDLFIQSLIIISLISFSIETLPDLKPWQERILHFMEVIVVIIFTIEYLLRILVADRKIRFIFSFFGLIDLLAILPFYVCTGIDLRSIRAFRFLRVFRAFKLVRYSKALQRFHRALIIAREEFILFLMVTLILIFLSGAGIYFFENPAQPEAFSSIFNSLWWAIATLTTVGYGDIYPVTVGGKIFTFLILLIGIGIISIPTGLLASALSKAREIEEDMD
jgi:voltage-gated potassium channel